MLMPGGTAARKVGSSFLIASTTSMVLVPGWRWIGEHDAALVVVPGGELVVLHAVDHAPEFAQPHRRAVAVGDHDRAE